MESTGLSMRAALAADYEKNVFTSMTILTLWLALETSEIVCCTQRTYYTINNKMLKSMKRNEALVFHLSDNVLHQNLPMCSSIFIVSLRMEWIARNHSDYLKSNKFCIPKWKFMSSAGTTRRKLSVCSYRAKKQPLSQRGTCKEKDPFDG